MYFVFRLCFFFFNDTATTEIYTLSLHDALPISRSVGLLRRISCRAEVGAIDFLEHARPLRRGARFGDSAGIQFLQRAGIFRTRKRRAIRRRLRPRLLHAIPKLPRFFPAPWILHL